MVSLPWHSPSQNASPLNLLLCLLPCVCVTRLPADIRAEDADWKQHIHCRQNQQARGHQSGGVRVLTQLPRGRRSLSCVRSSDSTQLSSWAVLHSRVVASRVCGRGRLESPTTAGGVSRPPDSAQIQRAGPGQPAGVAAAAVRWSAILPALPDEFRIFSRV